MKKVVLLLPDKVMHVIGNARGVKHILEDVTAESVMEMLCLDDYHESYKLRKDEIKILSFEEV